MADSVPVQANMVTLGRESPTSAGVGSGVPAGTFAAFLSGVLHTDPGGKAPLPIVSAMMGHPTQGLSVISFDSPVNKSYPSDIASNTMTELVAVPAAEGSVAGSETPLQTKSPASLARKSAQSTRVTVVPGPAEIALSMPAVNLPPILVIGGSQAPVREQSHEAGGPTNLERSRAIDVRSASPEERRPALALLHRENPVTTEPVVRNSSQIQVQAADGLLESAKKDLTNGTTLTLSHPDIAPAMVTGADFNPAVVPGRAALSPDPVALSDQVSPAMVAILKTHDATQSVVIHLQPAELGQVLIRIDRTAAGVAHVGITADRADTLQLLQRDEPRLQQVLDQAGVLTSGRGISFQASAPEQIGPISSRPDSIAAGFSHSGQGHNNGSWGENGDARSGSGGDADAGRSRDRPRWSRSGLDITA